MVRSPRWLFVVLVALMGTTSVHADSVAVSFVPGVTHQTTALTGFKTFGADMGGMHVTAYFTDNSSELVVWAGSGVSGPGAYGTGWSLLQNGDTFFTPFTLSNDSGVGLSHLVIDADLGDTVFDVVPTTPSTAGSSNGKAFVLSGGFADPINVTYADEIKLIGNPVIGDLYRQLTIQFDVQGGLASGNSVSFFQDTDKALFPRDILPVKTPAPPAVLLALIGAVPFLVRRRRA